MTWSQSRDNAIRASEWRAQSGLVALVAATDMPYIFQCLRTGVDLVFVAADTLLR